MNRALRYSLSAFFVAVVVIGAAAAAYLNYGTGRPLAFTEEPVELREGAGARQLAAELVRRGILNEPYSLVFWAHWRDQTRALKAGEYRFAYGTTMLEMLDKMVRGEVIRYSVTVVEGWSFDRLLAALRGAPRLRLTLSDKTPEQIMALLGHPNQHPEGRFFPDTYLYHAQTTDLDLLRAAHARMEQMLLDAWNGRDERVRLRNPDEALILASIVEKETARPEERPEIAGVFHNRLAKGIRLQTDPTVIYGLGAAFKGNLTRAHLDTDSPYNTYTREGLPPTPIALPGAEAIRAVTRPAETRALYFVARGDGSHQFSETLEEHNAAVNRYQRHGSGGKRS
jgi:UPF0755 protein